GMVAGIKVEEEIIRDLERLGIELLVSRQQGYWASMRIKPDLISRIKEAQKKDSEIWTIVENLDKQLDIPVWKWEEISMDFVTVPLQLLYQTETHVSRLIFRKAYRKLEEPGSSSVLLFILRQTVSPARGVRRFSIKGKLSPRFIGPFEILDRVGEVSYRLALPPQLSLKDDSRS
nr:putative reverse transcriptase domain-containing protein [Tanacetum cinerariifolium]